MCDQSVSGGRCLHVEGFFLYRQCGPAGMTVETLVMNTSRSLKWTPTLTEFENTSWSPVQGLLRCCQEAQELETLSVSCSGCSVLLFCARLRKGEGYTKIPKTFILTPFALAMFMASRMVQSLKMWQVEKAGRAALI